MFLNIILKSVLTKNTYLQLRQNQEVFQSIKEIAKFNLFDLLTLLFIQPFQWLVAHKTKYFNINKKTYFFNKNMFIHKCVIRTDNFNSILEAFYGAKYICFANTDVIPFECCLNCVALEKVFISKHTKIIKPCAFKNCISLKTVYIPKTVEHIHEYAFQNCINLKQIIFY